MALYIPAGLAQEDEQKSELRFIRTAVVQPSNTVEFENVIKKMVEKCKEYKVKYPRYAIRAENYKYSFVVPLKNHAGIDEYYAYKNDLYQTEEWRNLWKKLRQLYDSLTDQIFTTCPDLTFIPENSRLKPGEDNFRRIKYITIHNGKISEAKKIVKEMVTLYKVLPLTLFEQHFIT